MNHIQLPPVLRRWRFVAAAIGLTALAGGGVLLAANSDPATAMAFHPVTSTRLLDTRPATQVGTRSTPLGLLDSMDLVVALPDDATAVSLNITAVDGTEGSFLTIYPSTDARPSVSTINWASAGAVANSATVNVHSDHSLRIFNLKGTVNVVIDLLGYYAPVPPSPVPGPAGSVYLYANNTTLEQIPTDGEVSFDSIGPVLGGIAADVTKTSFTVTDAGVYKVSFGVVGGAANQIDILVDHLVPDSGALAFGGTGGIANEGTAVLALGAGAIVSLGNLHSGATGVDDLNLSDAPFGGTATEINAWITIEQLNS